MNKPAKITGVLVDVKAGTIKKATIAANLDSYHKVLDCDCIDIVGRSLGPYTFDVICDDEGLLKPGARVSAINPTGRPMFVGNLFFCHHDEEGNLTSLHPEEIIFILSRAINLVSLDTGEHWKAIHRLNYRKSQERM